MDNDCQLCNTMYMKTDEQKYHHNVAKTAVFDNVYGRLYFVAKAPQAGAKDIRLRINLWNVKKVDLVISTSCHTKYRR